MPDTVVSVAVPVPLAQTFDYLSDRPLAPGTRVRVPFGPRQLNGLVLGPGGTSPSQLKRLSLVYDDEPLLDAQALELLRWVARYYHHPIGEVVATALPTRIQAGQPARYQPPVWFALTEAGRAADIPERNVLQRRLLALLQQGPQSGAFLISELGSPVIKRLQELGYIAQTQAPARQASTTVELNHEQRAAVEKVGLHSFSVSLLDGVTGSGKTEVYIELARRVARAGGRTLVLVPEIGLTPQLLQRFQAQTGLVVEALHSGLTDAQRASVWSACRCGEVDLLVSTRSGVFTPLPDLGLIVVDEEHDLSYKQGDGLRYHARDVAIKRAQLAGVPAVLGSATPSLESLNHALSGRYAHLSLTQAAVQSQPLSVQTIDMSAESGPLSTPVREAIAQTLARDEQVLVFLNRRGFAPALRCEACAWLAECRRCDARLTWHRHVGELRCHHCGAAQAVVRRCPECASSRLSPLGAGTEKLEHDLRAQFPDTELHRIDRDSVTSHRDFEQLGERLRQARAAILVGTQMLAKGHDFPRVTLAVMANPDQALFSSDFRAAERAAQLLVQVAGRAGRGERPGRLLIQTHHPDHALFTEVLQNGYLRYASNLLAQRRAAGFPPVEYMALIRAESHEPEAAQRFLEGLAETHRPDLVRQFGPMPSAMERRAGRYRWQLWLQSADRNALHAYLARSLPQWRALPQARRVRWSVDIDPQDNL